MIQHVAVAAVAALAFFADGPVSSNPTQEDPVKVVFDFRQSIPIWGSIDDVVMGGISRSRMSQRDGFARFEGEVSLENNGGFASVRSEVDRYDLADTDGIVLRVRGDGKRYGLRLRTSSAFDGVSYAADFGTQGDKWQEIRLPYERFRPVFRGRDVPNHPKLDPTQIRSFGLIISDKQEGPFGLGIEWIGAFRARDE